LTAPQHLVLPSITTAATPRSDVVPGELAFEVPAHHGFVHHLGFVLRSTLALTERDVAPGSDAESAVLTVATAMVAQVRPWSPLTISIAIEDTDAFVRLSAEQLDPDEPMRFGEHARATLRRHVQSYEVVVDGGTVFAVLHVPLVPASPA
jgi:hypothetical protein